eukprot:2695042-Pleurochrysis_carterae.AAC.2
MEVGGAGRGALEEPSSSSGLRFGISEVELKEIGAKQGCSVRVEEGKAGPSPEGPGDGSVRPESSINTQIVYVKSQ